MLTVLCFVAEEAWSQAANYKELHKVKRKETIFGIARDNGLTVQELLQANPEMNVSGYELKKGDYIKIPYSSSQPAAVTQQSSAQQQAVAKSDVRQREVRIGVMLPLHANNGEGKRMTEYYRGILMACDSLKVNGISTDVRAWNVSEESDIQQVLSDPNAASCDLIIGPLYTKQVKALGDFAKKNDIRVMIPFSITSTEVNDNPNIFQVYQNGNIINEAYASRYVQRFKDSHTIIIDCNDTTSNKGGFTAALRRQLEQEGIKYSITNLKSGEDLFKKCFSTTQRNVIVLNTSRTQELTVAFAKLNGLLTSTPGIQLTLFGYREWLQHTRPAILENMYKFDTYIPSTYYMSPTAPRVERFKKKYRWNFHQDMQNYPQRFAATGFDHAYFMVKGLHTYGQRFSGASGMIGYTPLQSPLHFERVGNGGLQNKAILFVHYTRANRIETINF